MNGKKEYLTYYYGAEKHTFLLAKQLRKNSTPAEKKLWQIVRNRNLNGRKFRRQHPIAKYVVDFYCHQSKLVIELDGEIHMDLEQMKYDNERNEFMVEIGLNVLRIKNEDLFDNEEKVIELIMKICNVVEFPLS
jgi:very-short-patch-repair endonuclease